MKSFLQQFYLILIMDPLGNLPIFMSVLKHTEPKRRRAIMVRELLIALLVMLVFLLRVRKFWHFLAYEQKPSPFLAASFCF